MRTQNDDKKFLEQRQQQKTHKKPGDPMKKIRMHIARSQATSSHKLELLIICIFTTLSWINKISEYPKWPILKRQVTVLFFFFILP